MKTGNPSSPQGIVKRGNFNTPNSDPIHLNGVHNPFAGDLVDHRSPFPRAVSLRNNNPLPDLPSIYHTARVFTSPARYSFPVTDKGTHIVRLHFHPFSWNQKQPQTHPFVWGCRDSCIPGALLGPTGGGGRRCGGWRWRRSQSPRRSGRRGLLAKRRRRICREKWRIVKWIGFVLWRKVNVCREKWRIAVRARKKWGSVLSPN